MKRIILTAVAVIAACTVASAQKFGVTAGFTSSDAKSIENLDFKSVAQYNVGVTFNMPLPFGLAIQPSLVYQSKSMNAAASVGGKDVASSKTTVGYLELPVQVQWGMDLLLLRPYIFAEPFVGVGLNTGTDVKLTSADGNYEKNPDIGFDILNRMEYGIALGAGLDVWKLQVSLKYFWNLGNLVNDNGKVDGNEVLGDVKDALKTNYQGVTVNVAFFF